MRRRIFNPVQNDAITFLETSEETGGERSVNELDVAPGGKVTPHYHLGYSERFDVMEGELRVTIGDAVHTLGPGESATVPAGVLHAWANPSEGRTVARVELCPGQPGFELALRVVYGLAADGRVMADGLPRNPLHTALMLDWGKGRLPGVQATLEPAFRLLARIARLVGVERRLIARYAPGTTSRPAPIPQTSSQP